MADHTLRERVPRQLRRVLPRSVRSTLVLLLLVVLVPVLALQAGVYYRFLQTRLASISLARAVAAVFEAFVRDVMNEARAIGAVATGQQALSPAGVEGLLVASADAFPAVRDFSLLDAQGRVIASSDPGLIGSALGNQAPVQAIMAGEQQAVSDLFRGPGGEPTFAVARGIRDAAGSLQAIIVATVDPTRLDQAGLAVRRPGQGAVTIFDRRGALVFRFPEAALSFEERELLSEQTLVARALAGEEVTGTFVSPVDGQERLAAFTPIPAIGWAASSSRPLAEVLAPLASDAAISIAGLLLVAGAAFALALFISRSLTVPLDRLKRYAEAIGRGDYTQTVEVRGPMEVETLADALNRTTGEIRRREQEREDYTRIVSHDLRQPLTIIQGQAQLLQRSLQRPGAAESERRSAEAILTGARRMNAMIQDLVETARLEAGRLRLELRPVDMRTYLQDLVQRLAGVIETQRIRLEAPKDLPPVAADPNRLERILLNLLSNALKYSTPGTEVTVRLAQEDGEVITSVSDRGPGIPPEDLPRLFQRYYRAPGVRGRPEGLGLGLYITRLLVEAHGGRVWAESWPGVGSTFRFSLPVVPKEPGEPARGPRGPDHEG